MDSEIIYSLFGLLDQGLFVYIPIEVFYFAFHFFESLVHRYGTQRDWSVTQDRFAGLVYVFPGRKIHYGVGSPFDGPKRFFHLFIDRWTQGRVSDIGIDFNQKFIADDHRFRFGVTIVWGKDGTSGDNFIPNHFGSNCVFFRTALTFPNRDVLHFGSNNSVFGIP